MNRLANNKEGREELFRVTSHDIKLPEAIVEKDFWVCWTLNYLFHKCSYADQLAFKGGTSLSKCYGLIERFSEDLDLILDWRILGYSAGEPWAERSRTAQDRLNYEMGARTEEFLRDELLPCMRKDFAELLCEPCALDIDDEEPQTILFAYPRIFGETVIVSVLRLEIGALAAWTPTKPADISSYAAQLYPKVFTSPSASVLTVTAERTFWEKATILHKEAFREDGRFPARYSRHYYDLYCMDKKAVKEKAYADLSLLERVVAFKSRFYASTAARYDLAQPGTMRLIPAPRAFPALAEDYKHMENMIFGYKPSVEEIMATLERMEKEMNALS